MAVDRWEVIVAVGANLNLPQPIQFGTAFLGNPPKGAELTYPPDPELPTVAGPHVATLQQMTRVESNTFYWAVVEAENDEEAMLLVEHRIDPVVRVGLSLTLGHDVATQPLRVKQCDGSEPGVSAWASGSLIRLAPASVDKQSLSQLMHALSDDSHTAGSLRYLARASKYQEIWPTAGDLALDAAFLELAKALEYLVRKTPKRPISEQDQDVERELVKLKKTLTSSKGTKRKRAAVIESAGSLRRLEKNTVSDDVRAFSSLYALGPGWTAGAVKLVTVRHKHLAHPGEALSQADRALLRKGDTGARAVVDAALRAILERRLDITVSASSEAKAEVEPTEPGQVVLQWTPGRALVSDPIAYDNIEPGHTMS